MNRVVQNSLYNKKSEKFFFHTIYRSHVEKERTNMVVRAFEVRVTKEQQVADLRRKLDYELIAEKWLDYKICYCNTL